MRGHIHKRASGRYAVVLDIGRDPDTGKRRQKWTSGFTTKKAAEQALAEMLSKVHEGSYSEPTKLTVAEYLRKHWIPGLEVRASTLDSYTSQVERRIIPALGGRKLAGLTPADISAFYAGMRAANRLNGDGGAVSPRTVQYVATILSKALSDAVRLGMLPRNPATAVARPRAARPEMAYWSAEDAGTFLDHVGEDRLYAAWLLLITRGLRRGELVGLRWVDVDLDAGRMAIVQTRIVVRGKSVISEPKTARGRRSIPLDPQLVAVLRQHRRRQSEERLAAGPAFVDHGLVFATELGAPIDPQWLSRTFDTIVRALDVRRIRLHDLRHTCATLALSAGVPVKAVSEWLGHSSVVITLETYQHILPALAEEAGARLTSLVVGARTTRDQAV